MSRIEIQDVASARPDVRPRLQSALDASGFVPNLLGVLATAPTAIEAYQTLSGINARNGLTPAEREVVQITAALENGCGFCAAGHSKIASKKLRMDTPVLDAVRAGAQVPDRRLNALAEFTREVIAERGRVGDELLQAFLDAGYSQANALEVVLGVSLATLCNYANNLAQTPINPELLPFALA